MTGTFKHILISMIGVLLLLLPGCTQKTPVQPRDFAGRLWLRTVASPGPEGFFTGADGRLLLITDPAEEGLSWELHDGKLLLWSRVQDQPTLRSSEYHPILIEGSLFLATELSGTLPAYTSKEPGGPLDKQDYVPTYLGESQKDNPAGGDQTVYLRFDTNDSSLRGFAGVNNFYGSYERRGAVDFKVGPLATTMMSGPGMTSETKFMNCLVQADALLPESGMLFFFQGSGLLCSFHAD